MSDGTRHRLRGSRLVAAPFALLGLLAASLSVAVALWGAWHSDELGAGFVAVLASTVAVSLAAFAAARGCFVEVGADELRDVVAWRTRRRFGRPRIVEARVLAGSWRWFEVELDDGSLVVLVGASPVQFPSRLLPGAAEVDLRSLALLRGDGPDPSRRADR